MTTPTTTAPAPAGGTTAEQLPANTIAVFATLGGATVAMTADPDGDVHHRYLWTCLGCHDQSTVPWTRQATRDDANTHAGQCRSKPLPAR